MGRSRGEKVDPAGLGWVGFTYYSQNDVPKWNKTRLLLPPVLDALRIKLLPGASSPTFGWLQPHPLTLPFFLSGYQTSTPSINYPSYDSMERPIWEAKVKTGFRVRRNGPGTTGASRPPEPARGFWLENTKTGLRKMLKKMSRGGEEGTMWKRKRWRSFVPSLNGEEEEGDWWGGRQGTGTGEWDHCGRRGLTLSKGKKQSEVPPRKQLIHHPPTYFDFPFFLSHYTTPPLSTLLGQLKPLKPYVH